MPSISVSSVLELDLSILDDLENQWSAYINKTVGHVDEIRSDISKRLDEDNFDGETAVGVRRHIKVVTDNFEDNVDSVGQKIKLAVVDAIERFGANQEELRRRCDYAYSQGFTVADDGEVDAFPLHYTVTATPQPLQGNNPYAHMSEDELIQRAADAEDIEDKIKHTLGRFIAVDDELTQQLRGLDEGIEPAPMPLGASHSLDTEQAVEDILELWSDAPLSDADVAEINEVMSLYEGDSVFATNLLEELGSDGMLQMTAHITELGSLGNYTSEAEENALEFQNNMGNALALATNPNSQASVGDQWIDDVMESSVSQSLFVDSPSKTVNANGYYVLAPLLDQGGYHDRLMVPLAEHMVAIQADDGKHPVMNQYPENPFDLKGDLSAYPFDTMVNQLAENPETAASVFSGMSEYSRDEYPWGSSGTMSYDGWESILSQEMPAHDRELFGNALEGAATGVVAGTDPSGEERPFTSEENARVASDLINYVSENPDLVPGPYGNNSDLMGNFANITTHFIEDFHASYFPGNGEHAPATHGHPLDIAVHDGVTATTEVKNWMNVIGHDVDAMGQVWAASELYMYDQISHVMEQGGDDIDLPPIAGNHAFLTADITSGALDFAVGKSEEELSNRDGIIDAFEAGGKFAGNLYAGKMADRVIGGALGGELTGFGISAVADLFRMGDDGRQEIFEKNREIVDKDIENILEGDAGISEMREFLRKETEMDEGQIITFVDDVIREYSEGINPPDVYRD